MLPLGLSMLWEPVDPRTALAQRFGFADLDAVTAWVRSALRETWGVTATGCPRVVISDQNAVVWADGADGPLVVKWSRARERFEDLAASTGLVRRLAARGVPVAPPLATLGGVDRALLDGPAGTLSVAVLPEVTGEWLDVGDLGAVHAAGACLARLHRALGVDRPPPRPGFLAPGPRVREWLAGADPGHAPAASARLAELLDAAPDLDDEPQWVHDDFRAANVLTRGSSIAAVLDFDEVRVGNRVGDLAKACVYLGTRFTDWRPTPAAARRALRAGYESVRPLGPAESRWLEVLVLWQGIAAVPGPGDRAGWGAAL